MKKFLAIAFVFIFAGFSVAQNKVVDSQENGFELWSKVIKLTPDQKAKIIEIDQKYKQKKRAIRSTATQADFKALQIEKQKEIDAVLSDSQIRADRRFKERLQKRNKERANLKSNL